MSQFPDRHKVAIEKKIDSFYIRPEEAFPLGIIVNELISNAMKYAFADKENDRIRGDRIRGDRIRIEAIRIEEICTEEICTESTQIERAQMEATQEATQIDAVRKKEIPLKKVQAVSNRETGKHIEAQSHELKTARTLDNKLDIKTQETTEAMVRITIADNGRGLPPDFSFSKPTDFGLQMVKMFADQIRGKLSTKSQQETIITLEFPA